MSVTDNTAVNGHLETENSDNSDQATSQQPSPVAIQLSATRSMIPGRPVAPSDLKVLNHDTIPGHRPIFASDLKIIDAYELPGHRPVFASNAKLLTGSTLPGNRPVASNDLDAEDSSQLMGYLD
ncbi:MAG: hypothetical protein F6K19_18505 [Cyanothece sp. SIO1E1]|nr:hypothetical protein [Cyanothece sp. SIO1E1]